MSQFKTLKYRNDSPERFDSIEHARTWPGHMGAAMANAYSANPNPFGVSPQPPKPATAAWINPPTPDPK
ncbi:hypothetical protein DSI35_03705 [Mycobacterium tuberculosis]|uniref:Uncharacterized protein n=6 Tax=Mycobacterium tuberculosis complex TaxID=77643 RepID=Q8VJA2_MYCTO|nr:MULTISPECIES: hypothetical protein [Mycobacterium]AFE14104.1 hypothetical protein MRGA423_18380 [Mycobacterium tuberculosis RGTB423]AFE17764.1 hypothetical protein MRGA327_18185 [Mycobacterium tuberculosis RGTB327]AGL28400.1 hypothetical protein J113_20595 [Mycobacterium tuberculosis CAS/NITR204]AGL32453.1 hypothetical protein J114_15800 [Mycobacterium tuberculosis EAI5/NITR206]AHM08715.1 hypothetical protein BCGT_2796 [Mycobacterium tuberculosis variant bovis BCG str. ATCC 35743]EFP53642.